MAITPNAKKAVDTKINSLIKKIMKSAVGAEEGKSMASQKLLDGLNKAIAMDLRATIQFLRVCGLLRHHLLRKAYEA